MDELVPDDFDLDEARSKRSTTDEEEMPSCPHCGGVTLRPRQEEKPGEDPGGDYFCGRCDTPVDEDELES